MMYVSTNVVLLDIMMCTRTGVYVIIASPLNLSLHWRFSGLQSKPDLLVDHASL